MTGKKGLIPVKRMVIRNGKVFQQTVYIKPKYADKVDNAKQVEVPEWNFKTSKEFEDEVKRINKIEDRSERKVLKEYLLEHVEKDLGIDYGKVPDTEKNAFARNCLKAFSLAKVKINDKTIKKPEKAPEPKDSGKKQEGNGLTVSKQPNPGKNDFTMDRDASKKLAKDFASKFDGDLTESLKSAGITWNEVPEAGPNRMRALRALASFIRRGGELSVGKKEAQKKAEPKLVLEDKDKKLDVEKKSKYPEGSIQADYEKATFVQKAIALATGILPTDNKTTKYLANLIKSGQIGINGGYQTPYDATEANSSVEEETWGLTRYALTYINGFAEDIVNGDREGNPGLQEVQDAKGFFSGTEYEDVYKEVADIYQFEFYKKYSSSDVSMGTKGIKQGHEVLKLYDYISPNWKKLGGKRLRDSLVKNLNEDLKDADNQKSAEMWDLLGLDDWLRERDKPGLYRKTVSPISYVLFNATGGKTVLDGVVNHFISGAAKPQEKRLQLREEIQKGTITKKEVLQQITKVVEQYPEKLFVKKSVKKAISDDGSYSYGAVELTRYISWDDGTSNVIKSYDDFVRDKLKAFEVLDNPKYQDLFFNIKMAGLRGIKKYGNYDYDIPANLKPISPEALHQKKELSAILKQHVGLHLLETDKEKQEYKEKTDKAGINKDKDFYEKQGYINVSAISKAVKDAVNSANGIEGLEEFELPEADRVEHAIKSSMEALSDEEAKKVEKKVLSTHSPVHYDFKQVVHGVYKVKQIASRKAHKEWKGHTHEADGKGETGRYYHGTSYDTAQKILGMSGGFKVFKDSKHIKVGSMLGHGIYLASHSSKSAQYVGNGFKNGNRGVLFLCDAALGKKVTSTVKGSIHNQALMDTWDTDTVFMDTPHVLNPEWAVKNAQQAVPKLWIDIERVSNH